ncbi:Universal stress protein family protein [Natronoarchaeum philippinense]|uniref:Universal stress protein family protein n=1 Tax=Natronoarchaeum philippinense TaxID=558529 RepID=A0A285PA57_NATPI|nr:universal stress protein [Natronoarchaeum philippinense]SNZ18093.1 Universal stress protein family protein [Natronoarchaeum philippinense]
MRYLLATDSVHTTAAACDYLQGRLDADDAVLAVHVRSPADEDARDGREALNVATVRLGAVAGLEIDQRTGSPAEELLAAADEWDAEELVLGARGGAPGTESAVGSTTRAVLDAATRPVVIVPQEDL